MVRGKKQIEFGKEKYLNLIRKRTDEQYQNMLRSSGHICIRNKKFKKIVQL